MTYDDLNDIVIAAADMIEEKAETELNTDDRIYLNDLITAFLAGHLNITLRDD